MKNSLSFPFAYGMYNASRMSIGGIQALYLLSIGFGLDDIAFLQVFFSLSLSVFEYPCGYISDRFNPKYVVLLGIIITSTFYFSLACSPGIHTLIFFQILYGIGICMFANSFQNWMGASVNYNEEDYKNIMHQSTSVSAILSFFSGNLGIIISYVFNNFSYVYWIAGISLAIPFVRLYIEPKPLKTFIPKNQHCTGFIKTINSIIKEKTWTTYTLIFILFTLSIQIPYHFWQPLFISLNMAHINNYSSKSGVLLISIFSGIFLSQFIFNSFIKNMFKSTIKNDSFISIFACFSLIISTYFATYKLGEMVASILSFFIFHGLSSMIITRSQYRISHLGLTNCLTQALALTTCLSRIVAALFMMTTSTIITTIGIKGIFYISALGFFIISLLFRKYPKKEAL